VEVLYANCRQHNTSFKILAHLLGVRPRGCSLDELWHRFCDAHQRSVIIILDEVDLMSDKDRNRDILYLISRSPRNHMALLLSNHPKFLGTLDESIRSTLQPELVHFRNYDAVEIGQILQDRASAGLESTAQDVTARIAALTVRGANADTRVAIKALYYAATDEADDLENAFHRARRDLVADVLVNLSDANLLILQAIVGERDPLVKAVYARYRRLCGDAGQEPFSYVYFYSNLAYMQSIGLILLSATKVGRAYTNRVQVLFQTELLHRLWRSRFGC
jgi:cell division control protein 6